ncbi:MAG: HI0074 family nucleotidyltransferase substrate-binding subunit [Pseudomonadota bacterium]
MIHLIADNIDIGNLLKARDIFEDFRTDMQDDRDKAGAVQAFEFCFELAWKTMKRVLQKRGIDTRSPRDCFRQAALNKLISAPEIWFDFIEKRNLSVHTYHHENLEMIVGIFDVFSKELDRLIQNLTK